MLRSRQVAVLNIGLAILAFLICCPTATSQDSSPKANRLEGKLPSGATWVFDVPAHWNGTVLLYSHGHNAGPGNPARNSPHAAGAADWLLQHGYAMIGSSYASVGWALEDAVPDQLATLQAFTKEVGTPKRTIAWGDSMGGLVSLALVEQYPDRIDGGIPMCASVSGVVGMLNQGLDATFILKTLVDPDSSVRLVELDKSQIQLPADREASIQALLDKAAETPQGRARLALAAVIGQIPGWTDPKKPEPGPADYEAQQQTFHEAFRMGAFFPRDDQARRAGGNASWNVNVDYGNQLELSGRKPMIEAIYRKANIDLRQDLETLSRAPRISADPKAVTYMKKNYVPSGDLKRPVLSMHTTNDGMTMVTYESAYAAATRAAGKSQFLRQAFVHRAGHCNFVAGEAVSAILALEQFIDTNKWGYATTPEALNAKAFELGLDGARFVEFTPAPFLRPCTSRDAKCPGEP
jgi:pimeloyl-ACP methyl ester carboxylesterase